VDILARYQAMKKDARERGIKLRDGEVATLVLADILENVGNDLHEVDMTIAELGENLVVTVNQG